MFVHSKQLYLQCINNWSLLLLVSLIMPDSILLFADERDDIGRCLVVIDEETCLLVSNCFMPNFSVH